MEKNKILFDLIRNQKWKEFEEQLNKIKDIDVNIRDNDKNYLLNYIILFNKHELISTVVQKGSKIDIVDGDGRSIIYIPIKYRYDKILTLLLDLNRDNFGISILDIQDKNGNIPLHYTIINKNIDYIKRLIEYGSNINIADNDGNNSLHIAIYSKEIEICQSILDNNIDINSRNKLGETALHIACNLELEDIIVLLLNNGIKIDLQDYDHEYTSLSYSVNRNNVSISKILLAHNANPNIQDYYGKSKSLSKFIVNKGFLVNIFPELTLSDDFIGAMRHANMDIANRQIIDSNKIIDFVDKNNYYGILYQNYRKTQIKASKYWVERFLPSDFTSNKKEINEDIEDIIELNQERVSKLTEKIIK